MALRRTLETLMTGERINDDLYRSTLRRGATEQRPWTPALDPWRRFREITARRAEAPVPTI